MDSIILARTSGFCPITPRFETACSRCDRKASKRNDNQLGAHGFRTRIIYTVSHAQCRLGEVGNDDTTVR